ncbi:sushi domain-containing protein 1-like isoform X2 [Seriola lalandi dorsalis]|uniref:sushi domain-containing protein 1-like isoform X2 n=1 Tax=Seriola lalandi dorsalis TaxID=1841481 RepID=UPI000C6FCC15|nr:sushi domain-containing protein 1-like isoform X2 [Seriola lalandi dorsalis]
MIVVFLLFVFAGVPTAGKTLDVCATCHTNARCDDKADGSGKVCNCKYGFVGNGRTYCQDKDECQIGASRICGQHTTCHNTYGSYFCKCLSGYSPSNNMDVFIPNDGTHCQDIDECGISGQCGEGGQCRNTEGSFECSCQLGYRVHNGTEPFHPDTDKASCKVVDCGQPASVEDTVLLSFTGTTYGNEATFVCDEGFIWVSGDNISVCGANGLWRGSTMVCEEISCGDPPLLPHTGQVCSGSSTPGSTVTYYCKIGFYHSEGNNVSLCTADGLWTKPNISCKEVRCGAPPPIPHSVMLWDNISTVGSQVVYQCKSGYRSVGEGNVSVCSASGEWDEASLLCQEINCQEPVFKPHSKTLWDGTSHIGSVVYYQCDEGYHTRGLRNSSVCGENGQWEDIDLWCEAKCGTVPFLANSEVVWHKRSVVIHRCVEGYHSWRGSNVSVCGVSGVWQEATLRCIEIKPPINHLNILNEKCLHWKAEKYEEDPEDYKVTYIGSRDYQSSFHDKRKRLLSSKADQLELCLNLLPVTNYSISITAVSARFTATITTNTSLPVPPAPVVYYREFETPVPTLRLRRSANTLDPISLYQVFVLPIEEIMLFDCSSPGRPDPSRKSKSSSEYITAQIRLTQVGTEMNFTVGDGLYYGGFYNAPLENGRNYYIILRAVSHWKTALKSSCVLWAKIGGTSYVLKVSSLSAAASVGLVALAILVGYSCIWFFRRT